MTIKRFLIFILLLAGQLSAKANFNYDNICVDAYKAILCFRMNEAKALIQKEKQQNPQNGIVILLDNYVDYFSLLASENRADYEKAKDSRAVRVSALEDNDKNSPFYLYSQAEVYLQWSLLKAKFGDYMSSALDAKKASGLLSDNIKQYPDFLPNQKCQALVNVIFGSVPPSLKGVIRFLGMSGNVQTGIKQLESLRTELPKTKYGFYINEVVFFLCTMDVTVSRNTANYPKLMGYLSLMESNSLLKSYLQGYVSARTGHNDEAISFLKAPPSSNDYINLPAVDYMLGNALLNRMDSAADDFLNKYLKEYRGTSFIKDTYLKLAYFYLLQNDADKYEYYLKQVRTKGYAIDEKDKQALKEANDARPDVNLLKCRFYFDGGYYVKAQSQLSGKDPNGFKLLRDKIEFYYRLGRIYDKTNKPNEAVISYQRAIYWGKTTPYYYAANAALRIGNIFEDQKDYKKAATFYNQAIDMKDHEYKTSIDNDAKEGLKRVGQ
jgi:tetratricopeptide (TPR) repeat protein